MGADDALVLELKRRDAIATAQRLERESLAMASVREAEEESRNGYPKTLAYCLKRIGIPPSLHGMQLSKIPQELISIATGIMRDGNSAGLVGNPGYGKSAMCALAVVARLTAAFRALGQVSRAQADAIADRILWVDWPARSDEIKRFASANVWHDPKVNAQFEIEKINAGLDMVVIDDLGREKPSPFPVEQVFLVVDRLYNHHLGTQVLWSSNLPIREEARPQMMSTRARDEIRIPSLEGIYGPAMTSRLIGMAPAHILRKSHDQRWE